MMLRRHQLVYLHDNAPFTLRPAPNLADNAMEAVSNWLIQGWPCVVTSQYDVTQTSIQLGVPLYQAGAIYRLHLLVNAEAIVRTAILPGLSQVIKQLENGEDKYISVYGSFMWQYVTSQPYIHKHSDIDILISNDNFSLSWLKAKLITLQKIIKRNIDGEVRFSKFGDISIKELCQDTPSLIVKSTTKATLIERRKLYEYYPNLCR